MVWHDSPFEFTPSRTFQLCDRFPVQPFSINQSNQPHVPANLTASVNFSFLSTAISKSSSPSIR